MITGLRSYYSNEGDATVKDISTQTVCVHNVKAVNNTATNAYLQLFDRLASAVVLGTTAPKAVIPIGASGTGSIDLPKPLIFTQNLSFAVTTTPTGNTAPATDAFVSVYYA